VKRKSLAVLALAALAAACAPEPGSKAWCEKLDEKPKGDWSVNEAAEYAENCLLGDEGETQTK
jgi:hypothetical protein